MNSLLYYEAHITIEPVFGERLVEAKAICEEGAFRIAELLMRKRQEDTPERSKYDTFATSSGGNLLDIGIRTRDTVVALKLAGFKVWRYKIEDTLIDSRSHAALGILGG